MVLLELLKVEYLRATINLVVYLIISKATTQMLLMKALHSARACPLGLSAQGSMTVIGKRQIKPAMAKKGS